jgi:hypothetical protein
LVPVVDEPAIPQHDVDIASCDSSSDDEAETTEVMDLSLWGKEVAAWTYTAPKDEDPPADLLGWFVSWRDDEATKTQLSSLLCEARDRYHVAKEGAAQDTARAQEVHNAGDAQTAAQMLQASSTHAAKACADIQSKMGELLEKGLASMYEMRQIEIDAGRAQPPKDWEYKKKTSKGLPKVATREKKKPGGVAKSGTKQRDTAGMAAKVAAEKKRLAAFAKEGLAVAAETAIPVA